MSKKIKRWFVVSVGAVGVALAAMFGFGQRSSSLSSAPITIHYLRPDVSHQKALSEAEQQVSLYRVGGARHSTNYGLVLWITNHTAKPWA
jgi:hypothetical protein